jgi:hypothetical protein
MKPQPNTPDKYNPKSGLPASDYPALAALLRGKGEDGLQVFIVLDEDNVSTEENGNRCDFFSEVFLTEEEAQMFADETEEEWYTCHLRKDTLRIPSTHPDRIFLEGTSWREFAHHKAEEVANGLEKLLKSEE